MPNKINRKDLMASVVVFLVALPLCMGIALASGVPPAQGLVTGIIGGLITGFLAGSPLQVSGPAAGLTVLVYDLIQTHGIEWLGIVVLGAGLLQYLAGHAGLGRAFQAVSPAVIKGMLAGIGILIFSSQFHVMVDDKPRNGGLANLLSIPEAIQKGLFPADGTAHHLAAFVGVLTLLLIIGWEKLRPRKLSLVPAPLIAIVGATSFVAIMGWKISFISVPTILSEFFLVPSLKTMSGFSLSIVMSIIALAFIASAETLLCATAVDALHDGDRTDYNKELKAQGIGNICCGFLGALPMTGVIVRSSANVRAGAQSRASSIMHGAWLVTLVLLAPGLLSYIPTASLAGILVYIGYKLVDIQAIKNLKTYSRWEVIVYAATVITVVSVDLLSGVVTGMVLALCGTVYSLAHLQVTVDTQSDSAIDVRLSGAATFLSLPKLSDAFSRLSRGKTVKIHLDNLLFLDHACLETVEEFQRLYRRQGGTVDIEVGQLKELSDGTKLQVAV